MDERSLAGLRMTRAGVETALDGLRLASTKPDTAWDRTVERFRVADGIRCLLDGKLDGAVREVTEELERRGQVRQHVNSFLLPWEATARRDLQVATATAGGYSVDTETAPAVANVRRFTALGRLGATVHTPKGNVAVPRWTSDPTVTWLGSETAQTAESTPAAGQLNLAPKTVSAYVEATRQWLLQVASGEVDITDALAAAAGTEADAALTATGTGFNGQPTALLTLPGVTTFSAASLNLAALQTRLVAFGNSLQPDSRVGALTTPAVAAALRQRAEITGSSVTLWRGLPCAGTLADMPAFAPGGLPAGTLMLGADWRRYHVAVWGGGIEVSLDGSRGSAANFRQGVYGLRAMLTIDGGPVTPTAFAVATDAS